MFTSGSASSAIDEAAARERRRSEIRQKMNAVSDKINTYSGYIRKTNSGIRHANKAQSGLEYMMYDQYNYIVGISIKMSNVEESLFPRFKFKDAGLRPECGATKILDETRKMETLLLDFQRKFRDYQEEYDRLASEYASI